ncbi:MAG: Crp/Fnr family transcriptional regulator [bacterium]|nr:Crp/Fnr family transcriptional regulator [bacterium]
MADDQSVLNDLPLVRFLTESARERVIAAGFARSLSKNEALFHEGDPALAMYAVVEGQIKLVRYTPRGKELLLHVVHPGQTFAEAAMFGEGTYPANAVAVAKSRLWCWPQDKLRDMARAEPDLGLAMAGSVALWTRRLALKLELLTQRRVEERLAIYLLSRVGDLELVPGTVVALKEARNLIAAQCGTAPEVLSRTLKRMEEDGVIEASPNTVRILNPKRLRGMAEWID